MLRVDRDRTTASDLEREVVIEVVVCRLTSASSATACSPASATNVRSMSFEVRFGSSRRSSATPPFTIQASGSTVNRRASNRR